MADIERTKFGIQGLDKALMGGIPQGNIVLVSGGAGTGKSTLCLQFLVNGVTAFGEKALYISTEQTEEELQKHASMFGWDLKRLEEKNHLKILFFDITHGDNFLQQVDLIIKEFKPKRIVIDSLTTLTDSLIIGGMSEDSAFSLVQVLESVSPIPRTEQIIAKSILYKLVTELKKYRVTTIVTSELYEEATSLSADGISEFITDGVIVLHFLGVGSAEFRTMRIRKMRYSCHEKEYLPYELERAGVVIKEEEIFKP